MNDDPKIISFPSETPKDIPIPHHHYYVRLDGDAATELRRRMEEQNQTANEIIEQLLNDSK